MKDSKTCPPFSVLLVFIFPILMIWNAVSAPQAYSQITTEIVASEDSYVVQNNPATNFGTEDKLRVKSFL